VTDPLIRNDDRLRGSSIIAAIKSAGINIVLSVPDIWTSKGLLFPIAEDKELRLIRVCKEDEAVGITAGLFFCGRRAISLVQSTGLLDSLNAMRAMGLEYKQPICMLVGLLGKEPDVAPRDSKNVGVSIIEPVLDAMGIIHHLLETDADIPKIKPAIDAAYAKPEPLVLLIGRRPDAS
jgi:sulfopyruvate decarboxylase TPP-binding subunit